MRRIVYIFILIFCNCFGFVYGGLFPESLSHKKCVRCFIAYKTYCCAPPYLDSDAGEGFFAEGKPSQPLPENVLTEIRGLPTVSSAEPFLVCKIISADHLIVIGGFTSENNRTAGHQVVLAKEYARENGLQTGDSIQVKGQSLSVKEIVDTDQIPVIANIYMPISEAESLICEGEGISAVLLNMILVESVDQKSFEKAVSDVKYVIGASARIGLCNKEEQSTAMRK